MGQQQFLAERITLTAGSTGVILESKQFGKTEVDLVKRGDGVGYIYTDPVTKISFDTTTPLTSLDPVGTLIYVPDSELKVLFKRHECEICDACNPDGVIITNVIFPGGVYRNLSADKTRLTWPPDVVCLHAEN